MKFRDDIFRLHAEGKSRNEICQELGCSKSLLAYHLTDGLKERSTKRRIAHYHQEHPLTLKVQKFKHRQRTGTTILTTKSRHALYHKVRDFTRDRKTHTMTEQADFTVEDVIKKFGDDPRCYLTGEPINMLKPRTYALDHIVPVSRGGDNSLSNMGLCTRAVNSAKHNLTPDEFHALCESVVKHKKSAR